jgi:hypothetical protein
MAARIYRPPKIVAFNANRIWWQRSELSKQLQDLHIDVVHLSNAMRGSLFLIITYIILTDSREEKVELSLQWGKEFPVTMQTCLRFSQ